MTASTEPLSAPRPDLRAALDRLRREALGYATAKLDSWHRQVDDARLSGGATDRAVVGGVTAALTGGNPVRAALAGAWAGADAKKKALIIGTVLLLVVLAPVALLLLLLALLVAALLARRTARPAVGSPG
ncbi:MAG: hypothetical protein ACXVXA_18180 [Nocardioidaceae bacterium]